MEHVPLGRQGLSVSRLGLGCMGMSAFYGEADDARSTAAIRAALEQGIDLFDTADFYAAGHNERLLAAALGARRREVVLSVKSGLRALPTGGLSPPDGRPEFVRAACEASLRRLGVETIDLYCHARVDPKVPIEETIGAMGRLVEEGKIRFVGLSEAGAETLRRAHATHPISALQSEYSLFAREPEDEMLGICEELGVGFVASCPLGRGILGGGIRRAADLDEGVDIRAGMPWYQAENFAANVALVDRLSALAEDRGVSVAQLAIAWLLDRGVVPIPGSRSAARVEENAAAAGIVLAPADRRAIEDVARLEDVAGRRRSAARMSDVGR